MRRQEQRELRGREDRRLTGTRYLWLSNPGTLAKRLKPEEEERFDELRRSSLRTARAYALKEAAMELWDEKGRPKVEASWKWWHAWHPWAVRSRLEPIKRVARMIKAHLTGVINAIVTGVTNAAAESINSRIQRVKRLACGFRNRERFRNAIYFHLGGLDLSPAVLTHSKP